MPDENGLAARFREADALLPRRREGARGASRVRGVRGRVVEEHVARETAGEKGVSLAKKRGQAILIGHPRKETLAFLSEKLGLLGGKEGPRAVRVSELVP